MKANDSNSIFLKTSFWEESESTIGAVANRDYSIRPAALIEMLIFFAALIGLDFFFFDGTRFINAGFHPFWIIVILSSLQYGIGEGLIAAISSAIVLYSWNLPVQAVTQDRYEYIEGLVVTPLLWLVTAVIIGEITNRQKKIRRQLSSEVKSLKIKSNRLAENYSELSKTNEKLESRIVGEMNTVLSVYESAKALEKLEITQVKDGISNMVRNLLRAEKFSIFELEGDMLKSVVTSGWDRKDNYPTYYTQDDKLFQHIVGMREFLSSNNTQDVSVLKNEGIIAGPMLASKNGQVVGMIKIEDVGFLNLSSLTFENFKVVCEWVGHIYANALEYEDVKKDVVVDKEKNLMTANFFDRQTAFLKSLATRIGFPVSIILFRISDKSSLAKDEYIELANNIARAVKEVLRNTDLAFDAPKQGVDFAIILPNTPIKQTQIVIDKFNKIFGEISGTKSKLLTEIQVLNEIGNE